MLLRHKDTRRGTIHPHKPHLEANEVLRSFKASLKLFQISSGNPASTSAIS
jgi:hypothetical protein